LKEHLQQLLIQALKRLQQDREIPLELNPTVTIERTRERVHGDFSSNIAMVLAKPARLKPRELAERLVAVLPGSEYVRRAEVAGPGFINFFLAPLAYHAVVMAVLSQGESFGRSSQGFGKRVQVEFVSANPTGPLHVGHGRGAAFGDTVANLLEAMGFKVHREYYVNDAGRQMNILAASVWLRYLELCGASLPFPANAYKGGYVRDIAALLYDKHGHSLALPAEQVLSGLAPDESGDKEAYLDALCERAKTLLGERRYRDVFELGLNTILEDIRGDLRDFGIEYDDWYSERSLMASGAVSRAIERLRAAGHVYERDGALWFRSSTFGDEKDRVVERENGQTTYFASDIAYHMEKFERGFEWIIDIWGADHHGYVPRVKAALQAMGLDPAKLDILLVQFAILYRGGVRAQMSTRAGEFVTLRDLRAEVGNDAARFFYIMRKSEQHLDFDLDLARSQSSDNPLYYIQYAHARVCSIMRQLQQQGLRWDAAQGEAYMDVLMEAHEESLLMALSRYPEVLEVAALSHEPHQLAHYLRELAHAFHAYYNAHTFLVEDSALRNARLNLILAVRQIIKNGLTLLGVSAPEAM
jgi:arginyl-tRNA synthetase